MNLSKRFIENELVDTLIMIDTQIEEVKTLANEWRPNCLPSQLKDVNGNFLLTPLLLARASCLTAMLNLKNVKEL